MAACDEERIEWGDAFTIMVSYIFKMVQIYNLYSARKIAKYETTLEIEHYYPIQEDEDDQKRTDMEEVRAEVRSRRAYMDKWGNYEDIDSELEQIVEEKQMFDNYTRTMLESMTIADIDDTGEEE